VRVKKRPGEKEGRNTWVKFTFSLLLMIKARKKGNGNIIFFN
jgi:hypothetical protein